VVKGVDDECSDRELEDVKVVVKQVAMVEEVVEKRVVVMEKEENEEEKVVSLIVVVVETQWEESHERETRSRKSIDS
jgi:hypothetical protein